MEYCSHGTIEEAAKQGLSEVVIRRYTKFILTAVDFLHEHNVVHRDIKGLLCDTELSLSLCSATYLVFVQLAISIESLQLSHCLVCACMLYYCNTVR